MVERTLNQEISRGVSELWWLWVIQAVASILFGIVAIFWPELTLTTLVYLLAPFVIAIGLTETVFSLVTAKERDTWWMSLIIGVLTLGVGIYLATHPLATFATFVLVVGVTFIAWGILDVARSFMDRVFTPHRTLSFISGLAGIAAGVMVMVQPIAGGAAFVWVLGVFSLIYGIRAVVMSIDNHREYQELKKALNS